MAKDHCKMYTIKNNKYENAFPGYVIGNHHFYKQQTELDAL